MKLFNSGTTITTPSAATKQMIQQEFSMLKQRKQTLTIMILLFICMLAWGSVSLFSSQKETKVDTEVITLAKPLNPIIDVDTLAKLETKRSFTTDELAKFTIYRIVTDPKSQSERVITIDEVFNPNETTR
jgi:hypothetical protein